MKFIFRMSFILVTGKSFNRECMFYIVKAKTREPEIMKHLILFAFHKLRYILVQKGALKE